MEVIEVVSAAELLANLRPSAERWRHSLVIAPDRQLWLFRGQRNADWDLVPSRFRSVDTAPTMGEYDEPLRTRYREYRLISDFVRLCDREGLLPPGFELHGGSEPGNHWNIDTSVEIPHKTLDVYALAQHHGIETRLLDWTTSPLSAAYFAASGNWRLSLDSNKDVPSHFAVWAFAHYGSRQVKVVSPRFSDNRYLRSQRGCFSYDPMADINFARCGNWVPHNHLIEEDEQNNDGTVSTNRTLLVKIVAPSSISEDVLIALRYEGVDEATLMPSLDAIARCAKDQVLLSRREYPLHGLLPESS